MDLNYFYTFKEVAKWGSYTRAGQELGYAQSSVTTQVKKLEDQYNVRLFERSGQKMVLTQSGEDLLFYVEKILGLLEEASERLADERNLRGTIRIGTVESLAAYFITPYIKALKDQHPSLKIMLEAGLCPNLVQGILEGKFDIAVLLDRIHSSADLQVIPIRKEPMVMVASPKHGWHNKSDVSAIDLKHETIILTEEGCPYRILLEELIVEQGIQPQSVISFSSLEAIKQCVADDLGVALVPAISVKEELNSGKLLSIPFEGDRIHLYSQVIYSKKKYLSTPIRQLIEMISETDYQIN
ncbi:LysR family transcriptional regulator [Fictibacillus fluitans]|uniref:LysR family transcriptional regulator n=1 Tax=Fictibacillus fluitans TaxID=3058422 RepID=A0ABT8HWI9_9BACL|nr:LysR family transcriptional regulator [Fictibacillus sp. NE201]MDN4525111.1 LysR family transcriptional regulator [Fictibacillus sp. NE201]